MIVDDIVNEICRIRNKAIMAGDKDPRCIVYIDDFIRDLILREGGPGHALTYEYYNNSTLMGINVFKVNGNCHRWKVYRVEG